VNEHDGDSNQMRIKTLCSPRYMKCFFRLQTSKELLSRFASPLTDSTNHFPEKRMSISSVKSLFHFLLFLRQDPTVLRQEFPAQFVSSPCTAVVLGRLVRMCLTGMVPSHRLKKEKIIFFLRSDLFTGLGYHHYHCDSQPALW
jgi:hypothetical protein